MPAARLAALTLTEIVAGEVVPDSVAVSHGAVEFTVNGTRFPLPAVPTLTVCGEMPCVPPAGPLNASAVGEIRSTGFVVTTNETGIAVTLPPATFTINVVV